MECQTDLTQVLIHNHLNRYLSEEGGEVRRGRRERIYLASQWSDIIDSISLITMGSRHNRGQKERGFIINIIKENGEDIRSLNPLGIDNDSRVRGRDG